MRRFNFSNIPDVGSVFEAPQDHIKHMTKVLRLKIGDQFQASNGTGNVYTIEIISSSDDTLLLKVLNNEKGKEIPILATAFIGELKSDAMDDSIALLAEHGIQKIIPFYSERSIPKYDAKQAIKKQERRQKIALESIKKVGGLFDCIVEESIPWKLLEPQLSLFSQKIIFWEEEKNNTHQLHEINYLEPYAFIIGPEGGFSEKEIQIFQKWGATSYSLGTRILTAPHAAACAASIFRFLTEKPFL